MRYGYFSLLGVGVWLCFCDVSGAQEAVYVWRGSGSYDSSLEVSSGSGFCNSAGPLYTATIGGTFVSATASPSSAPTATGQSITCEVTYTSGGTQEQAGIGGTSTTQGNSGSCTTPAGTYDIVPPGNAVQAQGATVCGSDNCNYSMGPASSFRSLVAMGSGGQQMVSQTAVNQQTTCNYSGTTVAQPESKIDSGTQVTDCNAGGTTVVCTTQNAQGVYCGTYNGDEICVGQVPDGKCASYASGGVACTVTSGQAVSSPPAPNNGTAGTPASPTASLSDNQNGTTTTTNYYSSAVASHSTVATAGTGTGTSVVGNGTGTGAVGTGAGTGSGSGSGTGSGNPGDCDSTSGVAGSNASGCTGTVPSAQTPECTTYADCFENFWSEVNSAPIVQGVVALESDWPSGSCPESTITLGQEMNGVTLNYSQTYCALWENSALPILSATTLCFFALVAVFIVLSS